jgi:hypothetical protein
MRRVLSPGWIAGHLAVVVTVAGFLALAWWQVRRAAAGNVLSYAYAVEWPVFAGFVVAVWIRQLRRALRGPGTPVPPVPRITAKPPSRRPVPVPAAPAPDDPELAAYNRYLQWLAANPGRRPGDYPGA